MFRTLVLLSLVGGLGGCAYFYDRPPTKVELTGDAGVHEYLIAANDVVQIFVWKNPELSMTVSVRPDGKVSIPLVGDVQAAGYSPTQLSTIVAERLSKYVQAPQVTTIMQTAGGSDSSAIKVIGEAIQPRVIPYHVGITLVEVMADVGGLTDYADGNRAYLIRYADGKPKRYHLRVARLLRTGDMAANIELAPGDVISIPERWY